MTFQRVKDPPHKTNTVTLVLNAMIMTIQHLYSIPEPWVAAFTFDVQYELLQILLKLHDKKRAQFTVRVNCRKN